MTDLISYRNNLESFQKEIGGSVMARMRILVEDEPTFRCDFSNDFHYGISVIIETESRNYQIVTSQTETGCDTFWVNNVPTVIDGRDWVLYDIGERIIDVELQTGLDGYYYRIGLTTEKKRWILVACEIYNEANGKIRFQINDEMILIFSDENTLKKLVQA